MSEQYPQCSFARRVPLWSAIAVGIVPVDHVAELPLAHVANGHAILELLGIHGHALPGLAKVGRAGHALRYQRYGLGMGANTVEGVELLGHTGFIGAFAFHAPGYDAVLAGTHNDSQVDRWPLVAALCRELRQAT